MDYLEMCSLFSNYLQIVPEIVLLLMFSLIPLCHRRYFV